MDTNTLDRLAVVLVFVMVFGPLAGLWWYATRRGRTAFDGVDSPFPRRKRDIAIGNAFKVAIIPAVGSVCSSVGRIASKGDVDAETMWTVAISLSTVFLGFVILPFCLSVLRCYRRATVQYRPEATS